MTMHSAMKMTEEHKVITRPRSNEVEHDNTEETSIDVGKELIVGRDMKKKMTVSLLESMSEKIIILPILVLVELARQPLRN